MARTTANCYKVFSENGKNTHVSRPFHKTHKLARYGRTIKKVDRP